jgi:hypothetical protein
VDEQLVDASGKMMVLERLLDALFERGHKVLVFSQFVTMLNVIEVKPFLLFGCAAICSSRTTGMVTGLGARVQALAIMPHRRVDGPVGTPRGNESFPRRRRQAGCPTALPSEHACGWARHQPHGSGHRRVL